MHVHLLGLTDYRRCLALQEQLVFEANLSPEPLATLLLCEHPNVISVGRLGSRAHIRMSSRELESRRIPVVWVGRGGGCLLHAPGQLAVYPIIPIAHLGWNVGQYMQRLHDAVGRMLVGLGIQAVPSNRGFGLWGRSGLLASFGIAVRHGIAYHGVYINVSPAMSSMRQVDCVADQAAADGKRSMGSLQAEKGRHTGMSRVRASLIESLTDELASPRYHLHTGHPSLTGESSCTL